MSSSPIESRNSQEVQLAQRLRDEALARRPEFNEKLHVRIMEAVDPWRNPVAIYRDPPKSRLRRLAASPWVAGAVAASVLFALGWVSLDDTDSAPQLERIAAQDVSAWLLPIAMPEEAPQEAIVQQQVQPASLGVPSVMALAVTDPLKGFTLRTSQLPIAAAAGLGQLREANNRFAAELMRVQLASLDQDARFAANMLFSNLPMGGVPDEPLESVDPLQ